MWRFLCLFSFFGCATTPELTVPPVATESDLVERALSQDPDYPLAKHFDLYLQDRLDKTQVQSLQANCKEKPDTSVFCFTVNNRERLEAQAKEAEKSSSASRSRGQTIWARFNKQNVLLNWNQLRKGTTSGIMRALPKRNHPQMKALRKAALRESGCPNGAAIAVAAAQEDQLPKKITLAELGRLYEKGGACLDGSPSDQEQALTRGGLFYFADGDFAQAKQVLLKASSIEKAFTARALYWLYRVHTQLNESDSARKVLDELRNKYPFSFHSLVAQTAAGRDPGELLSKDKQPLIRRSTRDNEANILLEQVEILNRLGFEASAGKLLDWVVAGTHELEPEVMLYVAQLKLEQGDYKSKIFILSDVLYQNPDLISRQTMELYFPKVLFPIFKKQASAIDPYFLLAIARRESAFDPKAVSSANARGLLQILPRTGGRIQKKPNLFDPETNVAVGAKYITELLKRTDGHVHLALAAYNAGPGKLRSWTRTYPTQDPILFTDLIPFRETREYVSSVLRNYYWYRRIHQTGEPIPPEKLLEIAISTGS